MRVIISALWSVQLILERAQQPVYVMNQPSIRHSVDPLSSLPVKDKSERDDDVIRTIGISYAPDVSLANTVMKNFKNILDTKHRGLVGMVQG